MKNYMFILLLGLVLMTSACEDKDTSHFYITIKNQSENDVHICSLFTNTEGKCTLSKGGTLEKNSEYEFRPYNTSIERQLGGGSKSVLELYLVNPDQYNEHGAFYDCDLVSMKNDILKHYKLTLEDLRQMNFTITYP